MLSILRAIMLGMVLIGQVGLGAIDFSNMNLRTGFVAILIAIANGIVFWPVKEI